MRFGKLGEFEVPLVDVGSLKGVGCWPSEYGEWFDMLLDVDELYSMAINELMMAWHACGRLSNPRDSQMVLKMATLWESTGNSGSILSIPMDLTTWWPGHGAMLVKDGKDRIECT